MHEDTVTECHAEKKAPVYGSNRMQALPCSKHVAANIIRHCDFQLRGTKLVTAKQMFNSGNRSTVYILFWGYLGRYP